MPPFYLLQQYDEGIVFTTGENGIHHLSFRRICKKLGVEKRHLIFFKKG